MENLRSTLANARRLNNHKIISRFLNQANGSFDRWANGGIACPGRKGAHVDAVCLNGIHANPVAEEGSTRFDFGRVNTDHADAKVRAFGEESPDELIGE